MAVDSETYMAVCDQVQDLRQQLAKSEAKVDLFRRACEDLLDDRPIARAYILRQQAEAVDFAANKLEGMDLMRPDEFVRMQAQRLRQQADEAERAGGDHG